MSELVDNIFWHCLSGPHAQYTTGTDQGRRYASGFSPIVAFPRADSPDFQALAPFCASGEHFYCDS